MYRVKVTANRILDITVRTPHITGDRMERSTHKLITDTARAVYNVAEIGSAAMARLAW